MRFVRFGPWYVNVEDISYMCPHHSDPDRTTVHLRSGSSFTLAGTTHEVMKLIINQPSYEEFPDTV